MHVAVPSAAAQAGIPSHLQMLKKSGEPIKTADGLECEVWELTITADTPNLSEWAKVFRQNYCLDAEIDLLREGTGHSRAEFLSQLVFPDRSSAPGPAVRSGDFAELLIADFVEHLLGYWVPRGKYAEKASRDESVKGVDILGFKTQDPTKPAPEDAMLVFEVKAQLSGGKYNDRLQTAVDDSSKDYLRSATTLAALKRRLHIAGKTAEFGVVQRFQNFVDNPYAFNSGAAAILSDQAFDRAKLELTTTAGHNNAGRLMLIAIAGSNLMTLAHALYQRAADEA
jgi:hypothetical protein